LKEQDNSRTVAVLGASPKADRYSNMALTRLKDRGYPVIPVNPAYGEIDGISTVKTVLEAARSTGEGGLHTLTLYLAPHHLERMIDDIVAACPQRVIFNPGTETPSLQKALNNAGIPWMEACTLVLLSTGQY
jgi:predicted CoA-binding protein